MQRQRAPSCPDHEPPLARDGESGVHSHRLLVLSPDTIRLQEAISNAETAVTEVTVVSKVIPQVPAVNMLWTVGSGKPAFAGEATLDVIAEEAQTGEPLGAGSDRRVGGTILFDKQVFNSWGNGKNALDFWAHAIGCRHCALRGATICVKPAE